MPHHIRQTSRFSEMLDLEAHDTMSTYYEKSDYVIDMKAEQPQSPRQDTNGLDNNTSWWLSEIVWCCISVICVGFMVAVLGMYDGHQAPQWQLNMTLHTLVALLSSIATLAFLIPVFKGLGQLKWLWFSSRHRSLKDFELFDNATKGGLGSLKLLFKFKGYLACLASLILISSMFTSTSTQLMVTYYTATSVKPSSWNTTAPRATSFSRWNGTDMVIDPRDTLLLRKAILSSVYQPAGQDPQASSPTSCSSGTCEWDPFASLAICSQVQNLTHADNQTLLTELGNQVAADIGLWYQQTGHENGQADEIWPVTINSLDSPTGNFDKNVTSLAFVDLFVAFSNLPMTGNSVKNSSVELTKEFQYFEVILYWCVPGYDVSEDKGVLNMTQQANVSTRVLYPEDPHTLNFAWAPDFVSCMAPSSCDYPLEGETIVLAAPDTVSLEAQAIDYTLDVSTALTISDFTRKTLAGGALIQPGDSLLLFDKGSLAYPMSIALFGSTDPKPFAPEIQSQNIQAMAFNLAFGLSEAFRQLGNKSPGNQGDAMGRVYGEVQFVQIYWIWATLIAVQLVLASIFLTAIILATKKAQIQILKNSTLPAMMVFDEQTRTDLSGAYDVRSLKKKAKKLDVKLERRVGGFGVWLLRREAVSGTLNTVKRTD